MKNWFNCKTNAFYSNKVTKKYYYILNSIKENYVLNRCIFLIYMLLCMKCVLQKKNVNVIFTKTRISPQ